MSAILPREHAIAIIQSQGEKCFYCGVPFERRSDTSDFKGGYIGVIFDHLLPRHAGGSHDASNRVGACEGCDFEKGGRLPTLQEMARKTFQGGARW